MTGRRFRWLTAGLLTSAGAGVLSLTAIMHSAYAFGETPLPPDPNDIGLVMGGSGLPLPTSPYVDGADLGFINGFGPDQFPATYPGVLAQGLFTPEGLYPLTGVNTLHFNDPSGPFNAFNLATGPFTINDLPAQSTSVGQGLTILNDNILANVAADKVSTVFGYSQSSTISGLEMGILQQEGVPQNLVNFALIGDPSAPNGGLLERFNGYETVGGDTHTLPLSLPSLGLNFDGATPADDYTTSMYSLEYDGFTDFPRYPLNLLADLNAFLGIESLHGTYLNQFIDTVFPPADLTGGPIGTDVANAILLPGSAALSAADSSTNYYMIDTIDGQQITAPLVSLLDSISKPLGDLLGPDLTMLINLGYGTDPMQGWSATVDSPANVPTPFGLMPDLTAAQMSTLSTDLTTGWNNGLAAFEADLLAPAAATEPASTATVSLADIFNTLMTDFSTPGAAAASLTDIVNALSSVASTAYGTLLPTADILNALSTSVPAYDATLFLDNLQAGDLTDALGLPLAANTALDTLAAGFEFEVLDHAASAISATLSGLF